MPRWQESRKAWEQGFVFSFFFDGTSPVNNPQPGCLSHGGACWGHDQSKYRGKFWCACQASEMRRRSATGLLPMLALLKRPCNNSLSITYNNPSGKKSLVLEPVTSHTDHPTPPISMHPVSHLDPSKPRVLERTTNIPPLRLRHVTFSVALKSVHRPYFFLNCFLLPVREKTPSPC